MSSFKPMKTLNDGNLAAGGRRFRFAPLRERLHATTARPAALPALPPSAPQDATDTTRSYLHDALADRRELDLSGAFCDYAAVVEPLALSLPLVIAARARIARETAKALVPGSPALHSVAECLYALARDVGPPLFRPLLCEVVRGVAHLFDGTVEGRGEAVAEMMWDPDRALTPVFVAVARVAKLMAPALIKDPVGTVEAFGPLLAHSHYRVRELGAEATVGYLLRKARKSKTRHALVDALLRFPEGCEEGVAQAARSGAAVVVFEGSRAIHGGIHTGAVDVFGKALDVVLEMPHESLAFQTVVDAAAALRRVTSDGDALNALTVTLLERLEGALDAEAARDDVEAMEAGSHAVANASFLVRKWAMHSSAGRMTDAHQRRALNLAVRVAGAPPRTSRERALCESLGVISALLSVDALSGQSRFAVLNKSTRQVLASAAASVPSDLAAVSLQALRLALQSRAVSVADVQDAYAGLCDSIVTNTAGDADEKAAACEEACNQALLFFEACRKNSVRGRMGSSRVELLQFNAKLLKKHVISLLRKATHPKPKASCDSRVLVCLRLCTWTSVEDSVQVLKSMVETLSSASDTATSLTATEALRALAYQEASSNAGCLVVSDHVRWNELVSSAVRIVLACPSSLSSWKVLSAVLSLKPKDGVMKQRDGTFDKVSVEAAKLLSSGVPALRRECACALVLLTTRSSSVNEQSDESDEEDDGNSLKTQYNRVVAGLDRQPDMVAVYEAVWQICIAEHTMTSAAAVQQLCTALVTFAKRPNVDIREQLDLVLSNLALGMLRTRFKGFWKGAGELWGTIASLSNKTAWEPMQACLMHSRDGILSSYSPEKAAAEEDMVLDNAADETEDPRNVSGDDKDGSENVGPDAALSRTAVDARATESKKRKKRHDESDTKKKDISEDAPEPELFQPAAAGRARKRRRNASRRTQEVLIWRWNVAEWLEGLVESKREAVVCGAALSVTEGGVVDATDALTLHLELLHVLRDRSTVAINYRSFLMRDLYLILDTGLMSRRTGCSLVRTYCSVFEKVGGLKGVGEDTALEEQMRSRWLRDMYLPEAACQSGAIKCLAVARSPEIRRHKESLLRLANDSSFRDELASLTSEMGQADPATDAVIEPGSFEDALIRICFGKMKGRRGRLGSRRSAVLSFIVSALSWSGAIPCLIGLALSPMPAELLSPEALSLPNGDSTSRPRLNVCRGILHSLDAIVDQFGAAIPASTWNLAVVTVTWMLKWTSDVSAKTVRSMALRRLSAMLEKRSSDTEFIVPIVLACVRGSRFDVSSASDVTNAPGLLLFLGACAKCDSAAVHERLVLEERWVHSWIADIVKSSRAHVEAVAMALDVADMYACWFSGKIGESGVLENEGHDSMHAIVPALETRIAALQDMQAGGFKASGWRSILGDAMRVVGNLPISALSQARVVSLSGSLLDLVTADVGRTPDVLTSSLHALAKLNKLAVTEDGATAPLPSDIKRRSDHISSVLLTLGSLFNDDIVESDRATRNALCEAFSSVGRIDTLFLSGVLKKLGEFRTDRVLEPDYDTRLKVLSGICKIFPEAVDQGLTLTVSVKDWVDLVPALSTCGLQTIALCEDALPALVYSLLRGLKDEDTAARGTAGYALTVLARWTAKRVATTPTLSRVLLQGLVLALVRAPEASERRETCIALGELVRCSVVNDMIKHYEPPIRSLVASLSTLSSPGDLEVDFFENLGHLQPHRRSRALRRLSSKLDSSGRHEDEGAMEDETCNASPAANGKPHSAEDLEDFAATFALPLCMRMSLDVADTPAQKSQHARSTDARAAAAADVLKWACAAFSSAAKHIVHKEYKATFLRILRRIPREQCEKRQQALYNLLVAIADAFPSTDEEDVGNGKNDMTEFLSKRALPEMLKHVTGGALEGDLLNAVVAGHTKSNRSSGSVNMNAKVALCFRSPVAISAAKLMRRLPLEDMETCLPMLVTPVAGGLRSRMSETREGAKKALVQIVVMFEGKYLPYIVEQVLSVLAQGFRKDAIVFVLHALLQGVQRARADSARAASSESLKVDTAARQISDALKAELVEGTVHNSKDFYNPNVSSGRAKDTATRATRAYDAMEILGELVSFKESAMAVVEPFRGAVLATTSGKVLSKLENALQRLVLGFVRNSTLVPVDGLMFAHELVHDFMPRSLPDGDKATLASSTDVQNRQFFEKPNARVIAEFGLKFLNSMLSKSVVKVDGASEAEAELRGMLEPFLPELGLAMKTAFDSLTLVALRVTQRLVRLPLKGREAVADDMICTVLDVLSRQGGHGPAARAGGGCQELFQTCLRVGSVIIYEVSSDGRRTVSEEAVRQLVVIARQCLAEGNTSMRNAALSFVRTVVNAKFKVPEVYDAVDDVSRLAVQGQSSSLQASCIAISVSFLVNFPLSDKRIKQHLDFFVRNLSYEHASGRLAAVHALETVVSKFPKAALAAESEFVFLPLAAVVASDADEKCREGAVRAVKTLFTCLKDGRKLSDLLDIAKSLLGITPVEGASAPSARLGYTLDESSNAAFRTAGAHALGAAVDGAELSVSQAENVLELCLALGSLGCVKDAVVTWDVTHASLCTAEKALEYLSSGGDKAGPADTTSTCRAECKPSLEPFWRHLGDDLSHEHVWVRLVLCRLLGRHFAALGDGSDAGSGILQGRAGFSILLADGSIRDLVKGLCLVLESSIMSEALAEQALKNLVYLANAIRRDPSLGDANYASLGVIDVDAGPEGEADAEPDADNVTVNADSGPEPAAKQNRGMYWLLRRMAGMATRVGAEDDVSLLRRACGMRFLASIASSWPAPAVRPYAHVLIGAVMRELERGGAGARRAGTSDAGRAAASAVTMLAEGMQARLIAALGGDAYYAEYNALRARRRGARDERKRKLAVEAATDAERAAKKRLRRAAAKRGRKAAGAGSKGWRVSRASFRVDGGDDGRLGE